MLISRLRRGWEAEAALTVPSSRSESRLQRRVSAFGETKSIEEWAEDSRAVVSGDTILWRVQRRWNVEEAIATPLPERPPPQPDKRPTPPRLFEGFGTAKTLREWLEDSRCTVTRPTLERNLRDGMAIEQALSYKRAPGRRTAEPTQSEFVVADVNHALRLMSQRGELWHTHDGDFRRISILVGDNRHDVPVAIFEELCAQDLVRRVFRTASFEQFILSDAGKRAVRQSLN